MRAIISWVLDGLRDNLALILVFCGLAGLGWIAAAPNLSGARRLLWPLVPVLLAIAAACWVGPGRLFAKKPFEGPILLPLSWNHAVTLLDLAGLVCAGAAVALGSWLVLTRRT